MGTLTRFLWAVGLIGLASCTPVPDSSYAADDYLRPDERQTVAVGGRSFTVLTFKNLEIESGECFEGGPCVTYSELRTLTEVFGAGGQRLTPEDQQVALEAALVARCPSVSFDANDLSGRFRVGIWVFDSLCPSDRETD